LLTMLAITFEEAQKKVADILDGRILVGHAIKNDLECVLIGHPKRDIRDTSRHPEFRKYSKGRTPGLKKLAKEILGIEIQDGAHSSVGVPPLPLPRRNTGARTVLTLIDRPRLRTQGRVCCCTVGSRTTLRGRTRSIFRTSQRSLEAAGRKRTRNELVVAFFFLSAYMRVSI
jgi:hypothetical protein